MIYRTNLLAISNDLNVESRLAIDIQVMEMVDVGPATSETTLWFEYLLDAELLEKKLRCDNSGKTLALISLDNIFGKF